MRSSLARSASVSSFGTAGESRDTPIEIEGSPRDTGRSGSVARTAPRRASGGQFVGRRSSSADSDLYEVEAEDEDEARARPVGRVLRLAGPLPAC